MSLFDKKSLEHLEKGYEDWKNERAKGVSEADGYTTDSGIPVKLLYTPLDIKDIDYDSQLGFSGAPPFVRGIYPNMYRGRMFTQRQLAGFGSPSDLNKRFKFLLANGATGVNTLFDLPTIRGYDSDSPQAAGNVGHCGCSLDSVIDMEELYDGIPIDEVSVSVVTHLPSTTVALLAMYVVMAEKRGIPLEKLSGTNQNDFIMETCVGSAPEILPPRHSFRLQCDAVEYSAKNLQRWNPISYNGYNLREAGTDAITEVGVALSNAIATSNELIRRGMKVDQFARRLSFFWDLFNDFFEEIAKCRASRKVYHDVMKERFGAQNERSLLMRYHVQTAGITLTAKEPLNNVARSAIQGLAAILGGAQSLHIDSYDEAYSAPTEEASLVSLRTQQIIGVETNVTSTVDPLAGSFFVEYLTNQVAEKIKAYIAKVDEMGGLVAAVESGWLHNQIADFAYKAQREIESGERKIAGVNYFPQEGREAEKIEVFRYPEETEARQKEKLRTLRETRNNEHLKKCFAELRAACHEDKNVMPFVIEAVRSYATLGEIEQIFRDEFGLWQFPLV
ncbi:MAG: methylmalonyl-CoA mutase [Deltaproteobacteria bacterium]|nr:methylmalonyl-CoA mutase [Deltaproteobacteria bacterium]